MCNEFQYTISVTANGTSETGDSLAMRDLADIL
jgi:hypothetical protein